MSKENRFSKRRIRQRRYLLIFLAIWLTFSSLPVYAEEDVALKEQGALETEKELGEYFLESVSAMEYTEEEVDLLARLIFAEAGVCDTMEKYRVGNVVLNRVNDTTKEFKNTIKGVIYQEGQFTSVGGSNWKHGPNEEEIEIAKALLEGTRVFPGYVVWFAKRSPYGQVYYTSEWHEFSGWEEVEEPTEEETPEEQEKEPKRFLFLQYYVKYGIIKEEIRKKRKNI